MILRQVLEMAFWPINWTGLKGFAMKHHYPFYRASFQTERFRYANHIVDIVALFLCVFVCYLALKFDVKSMVNDLEA